MILKTILINEIKYILQHEPTDKEYRSALEYISESLDENATLGTIAEALRNWQNDCLVECIWCGEYFLPSDWCGDDNRFCSDKCKEQYIEDEEFEAQHQHEVQSMWNER